VDSATTADTLQNIRPTDMPGNITIIIAGGETPVIIGETAIGRQDSVGAPYPEQLYM
jgi:hypothetical protein